jgi:hypothetical protein
LYKISLWHEVFANKSSFSRVEVGDPADDWAYKVNPHPHVNALTSEIDVRHLYINNSEGTRLLYKNQPISTNECKMLEEPKRYFIFFYVCCRCKKI